MVRLWFTNSLNLLLHQCLHLLAYWTLWTIWLFKRLATYVTIWLTKPEAFICNTRINISNSGSRSISSETHSYNENDHLLPLYRQPGSVRPSLFLRLLEVLGSINVDGASTCAILFRLFVIVLVALSGLFVWKLDICNGWIEYT